MGGAERRLVPVIVGPTAAGKTAVAHALGALESTEIVSADSRQVYRGLDIGTAKPTPEERGRVPYHGLDIVDPTERYSAGRFARDATSWIAAASQRGRLPVVVGGTGLYLKALFTGLFDQPALDDARRERLRDVIGRLEPAEQARWAGRLDAGFGGGGRQRAQRAIEVALLTGAPLSRLQRASPGAAPRLRPWYARLVVPRDMLKERIARRVDGMLQRGLIDEVRQQLESGVPASAPGLSGVGYRETVACLAGRLPRADLAASIAAATWQYARRQETWFRRQLDGPVTDLDGGRDPAALARAVMAGYRAALETP